MNRLATSAAMLVALATVAGAQPAKKPAPVTATVPATGEAVSVMGASTWPTKVDWLYDVPSATDAAGKIVIHWFCAPKIKTCEDDLARIVTLKENGRVYVVAHINGTKRDAQKLDPIRESEGVGRGSVAFGKATTAMMKQMGVVGPASIIVDLDGKVALVSTGSSPQELDARDAKVNALVGAIKEYVPASSESPKGAKPGDKFALSMTIKLASWLKYSAKQPHQFTLTAPPDFKCDAKQLTGDQIKIDGQTLTATVTCTAPKGSYEARGELRFGYETPSGGAGLGTEGAKWKFEVKP